VSFEVVLFDLDGTLIDSVGDVADALNKTLAELGRAPLRHKFVETLVGGGARVLMERALEASGGPSDQPMEQLLASYLAHYRAQPAKLTTIFPGVPESLAALKKAGFRLAICSNKPHEMCVLVLRALKLDHFFDAVTGGDNVPKRKPDGDHCRETLRRMGAEDASAIFIGDSATDFAAARNAGLPIVLVKFGYSEMPIAEMEPDGLIGHFDELLPLLGRLQAA
jgi:phosphoglycolate phosphatase